MYIAIVNEKPIRGQFFFSCKPIGLPYANKSFTTDRWVLHELKKWQKMLGLTIKQEDGIMPKKLKSWENNIKCHLVM